jgi:hypothetical protein
MVLGWAQACNHGISGYQAKKLGVRVRFSITRHVGVNERADIEYYCASACMQRVAIGYDLSISKGNGGPAR